MLQGTLLVAAQPPFAELHLQHEQEQADNQAEGVAAIGCQIEAEGEIDEGSRDGLGDVVGEAHPAVEAEAVRLLAERLVLIEDDERGYQYQGERQLLPHVEHGADRLLNDGVVAHNLLF